MKPTDYAIVENRLFKKTLGCFQRYHKGAISDITDVNLTSEERLLISRFELDLDLILNNCEGVLLTPLSDKTTLPTADTIYHIKAKLNQKELVSLIPLIKPYLVPSKSKVFENPINAYSASEFSMDLYYIFNFSFRNVYMALLKWLGTDLNVVHLKELPVLGMDVIKTNLEDHRRNIWTILARNNKDVKLVQNQLNELYRTSKGSLNILGVEPSTDFDLLIAGIKECKNISKQYLGDFPSPLLIGGMVCRYLKHTKGIDNFPLTKIIEGITGEQRDVLYNEVVIERLIPFPIDDIIHSFLDGWSYENRIINKG